LAIRRFFTHKEKGGIKFQSAISRSIENPLNGVRPFVRYHNNEEVAV
jgi:hypothetical protein